MNLIKVIVRDILSFIIEENLPGGVCGTRCVNSSYNNRIMSYILHVDRKYKRQIVE